MVGASTAVADQRILSRHDLGDHDRRPHASVTSGPPGTDPTQHTGARLDRNVRTGAARLLWFGLLLVTHWWVADGGVTDLSGWESGLTSVDRLSGLWSADLLLVQVRLMSRLPLLEHAFGRDRLVQTHRVVGFLSFDLMLVHVVTIIAGYAGARWAAVPSTTCVSAAAGDHRLEVLWRPWRAAG